MAFLLESPCSPSSSFAFSMPDSLGKNPRILFRPSRNDTLCRDQKRSCSAFLIRVGNGRVSYFCECALVEEKKAGLLQSPFVKWLREGKIPVLKRDQRLCYCPPHEIREDLYDKPEILWGVTAIVCRSTISSKINNQLQIVTFRNQNSLVDMAYLNEQKAAPKRDGYYSIPGLVPYLWLSNGTNITDRRTNRCRSKEGS